MENFIKKKAGLLLLTLGVMICSGCMTSTKKTEWTPAEPVSKPPFIHIVKYPGETLSIISEWYTGNAQNREALADANPNLDYDNMASGSRIFIPENLLKTTKHLTKEYIDAYSQKNKPKVKKEKKKAPAPAPKKPPKKEKDEDFDLIGPK